MVDATPVRWKKRYLKARLPTNRLKQLSFNQPFALQGAAQTVPVPNAAQLKELEKRVKRGNIICGMLVSLD